MSKIYDQNYFDRWYRDRTQRVISPIDLELKVRLTLAVAEYHLGRPVRTVLDVGCGEGAWRAPLLRHLPQIDYLGLDSSEYAIARYGRTRNLRLLRFAQLAEQRFDHSVDLLICADMMHYVPTAELNRGLSGFAELCHGVAYLEVMCGSDDFVGDRDGYLGRTAAWYRKTFAKAGFLSCGNHCYLSQALRHSAMALELC
jgi:SAM-dependent methyltransferase